MTLRQLKEDVCAANKALVSTGLVIKAWGNVSGIHRTEGVIVIKPSGVAYDTLTPDDMVIVDMNGRTVEGTKRPSSDTPTHIELYKAFPGIGGIAHTHSVFATMFAQARKEIPCLGTTHADQFAGAVPVTRFLTQEEVDSEYERNTGHVIVECFAALNPVHVPAVLVAGHAPFCWGKDAFDSVATAVVLERVAEMAFGTMVLAPAQPVIPSYLLHRHFFRKNGPGATYGQRS